MIERTVRIGSANGLHARASCPPPVAPGAVTESGSDETENHSHSQYLGSVRLLDYRPGRVQAEAEARAPALLLLADTWDVGWSVRLDGAAAPSLAADGALRAVAVPAGHHLVEWRYRAPGLARGAAVSALCLCVLFALLWRSRMQPAADERGT